MGNTKVCGYNYDDINNPEFLDKLKEKENMTDRQYHDLLNCILDTQLESIPPPRGNYNDESK